MNDTGNNPKRAILLDAWRTVFERTNRIISGADVRVRVEDYPPVQAPAWTDGDVVTFNGPEVTAMLNQQTDAVTAVLKLKGLNYHELCHVLYTPRRSDSIVQSILRRGKHDGDMGSWWFCFNALEDQRIENMFSAIYTPSRRYFESTMLHYLVRQGTVESAILMHGRKYVSPDVRVRARAAFEAKYPGDLYQRFAQVIDAYLLVDFPTATLAAEQLIVRFHDLCKEMSNAGGQMPLLPIDDHHEGGGLNKGRIAKRSAAERRQDAAAVKDSIDDAKDADAKAQEKLDKAKADKASGDTPKSDSKDDDKGMGSDQQADDGSDDSADGTDQAGNGTDGDGAGGGQQTDQGDGSGQSDGDGDTDSTGGGAGTGFGGDHDVLDAVRDLMDAANAGIDDIEQDDDVQADADAMLDAVKAAVDNGKYNPRGDMVKDYIKSDPSATDLFAVRRIGQKIAQIKAKAEPEILRQQTAGRVDVRRAITRQNTDVEIFTRYDEGALDDTGMEVVLLVDISGSMGGVMPETNRMMWTLKRSFDKALIPCTVILYESGYQILWAARQKAGGQVPNIGSRGGTQPQEALDEALNILSKSNEPNKVLVTLTDGQWMIDDDDEARLMRGFAKAQVHTMLLGLQSAVKHYGKHRHQIGHDLSDVEQLPKAVSRLVEQIMRTAVGVA